MDAINDFILTAASSPWMLLVMFAVAAIDAVFPPVPSETVLVAGAAAAMASGDVAIVPALCLVAALGAALGDNLAYALGRKLGSRRFAWMERPKVAAAFAHARTALNRNGAALIIGARYIPVGRVAVNMSAGALGYPWRRFLPVSIVAGITWAAYGAAIGLIAGSWVKDQPLVAAVLGVVIAMIVGIAVDRLAAHRRRRAERSALPVLSPPAEPALSSTAADS
ncbi:membrane protein DedA with SNARE-associated domain [Microbacterium resistens]|uniref:Membrane protein DedA with SNARE-associated domain n=1 Tax=Microbacterium resistens TaxID=156977 RepID=A0ABU1S8H1_9MICO|nr:DedA family protein [Microbacterium resistens]MDR6865911.1 membrane protein DedA with SNARE-associated domain [Microbacterium resistens]